MKRFIKCCTILSVFLLVFMQGITLRAAGSVAYDSSAREFIFEPGTKHSPTNLFENFQDVMPGDTLTEQILIRNDAANGVKIKVYMRSLGAQKATDDFLSQMKLTVQQKEEEILFAAPADETTQLDDWMYLGMIYSGGEITLDLTLEVPVTMGNEYQNEIGYIDWEFKVEELPVEESDPEAPKTGDDTPLFLYFGLLAASMTAVAVLLFFRRKNRQAEQC